MKYKILTLPFIFIIIVYQFLISPILGKNCRYLPTCSQYAIESLKSHGLIRGLYFAIKRILRCHPFGGQGYDPTPKIIKKKFYE